ncbi:integrase core domain-containing protein, partial [Actinomycetospora aeridis]
THSRPYNPRCCGKIERLHQTARGWLARRPAPATMTQARALFAEFTEHYNTYRPHQALDGALPAQRYRPGAPTVLPVLEVEPADAHLPAGALLREVNRGGRIGYAG